MENLTTGAGLGALGFWLFIAAIIAVGVWDSIRKRDAQHETLRRIIESGQSIDEELTDKILALTGGSKTLERDMWVSGLIVLSVAPGLAVFGWVMSLVLGEGIAANHVGSLSTSGVFRRRISCGRTANSALASGKRRPGYWLRLSHRHSAPLNWLVY